jgi:hypothetical protein
MLIGIDLPVDIKQVWSSVEFERDLKPMVEDCVTDYRT